jgi:Hyaluronidase
MLKHLRSLSITALVCLTAGMSMAQSQTEARPFTAHWGVATCPHELRWRTTVDWAQIVEFEGAPIRKDAYVLYEHDFLLDVRDRGLSITTDPAWNTAYDARLDTYIAQQIPNPNFDGIVCIDVEFLAVTWGNRTGGPGISPQTPATPRRYFDEWYDYIRTRQPALLANRTVEQQEEALRISYEQAVKDLFLRTIQRMQTLRPNAKFGYYSQPLRRNSEYTNPATQAAVRAYNDNLRWLFDAQDVFFLELYQRFFVAETPQQVNWNLRWPQGDLERIMQGNIEEARRVAGEKPVYVLTMVRFSELTPGHEKQPLTDELYDLAIRSPKQYGADGIVIWDFLRSDADRQRLQTYMTQHVNWRIRDVTRDPNAPAADPLADAGSAPDPQTPPSSPTVPDAPAQGPAEAPPAPQQPRAQAPNPPAFPSVTPPAAPISPLMAPPAPVAGSAPVAPVMAPVAAAGPSVALPAPRQAQRRSAVVPQRGIRVSRSAGQRTSPPAQTASQTQPSTQAAASPQRRMQASRVRTSTPARQMQAIGLQRASTQSSQQQAQASEGP